MEKFAFQQEAQLESLKLKTTQVADAYILREERGVPRVIKDSYKIIERKIKNVS